VLGIVLPGRLRCPRANAHPISSLIGKSLDDDRIDFLFTREMDLQSGRVFIADQQSAHIAERPSRPPGICPDTADNDQQIRKPCGNCDKEIRLRQMPRVNPLNLNNA
jgi:hypothetical protein